jgi:hypothetical protein
MAISVAPAPSSMRRECAIRFTNAGSGVLVGADAEQRGALGAPLECMGCSFDFANPAARSLSKTVPNKPHQVVLSPSEVLAQYTALNEQHSGD